MISSLKSIQPKPKINGDLEKNELQVESQAESQAVGSNKEHQASSVVQWQRNPVSKRERSANGADRERDPAPDQARLLQLMQDTMDDLKNRVAALEKTREDHESLLGTLQGKYEALPSHIEAVRQTALSELRQVWALAIEHKSKEEEDNKEADHNKVVDIDNQTLTARVYKMEEEQAQQRANITLLLKQGPAEGAVQPSMLGLSDPDMIVTGTEQKSQQKDKHKPKSEHTNVEVKPRQFLEDRECAEEGAFNLSVWDAMMFVGDDNMGIPGSMYTILMFVVNTVVQALFIMLVFEVMGGRATGLGGGEETEAIKTLIRWRLDVGHNLEEVNKQHSLVARVCSHDGSLNNAASQASTLKMVVSYLPRVAEQTDWFHEHVGPIMSFLSILVWALTCSREFESIKTQFMIFCIIPKGRVTVYNLREDDDVELSRISKCREWTAMMVLWVRFVMFVFLLCAGMTYLSNTFVITDLLLNAVALEIVLNIDETIFDGVAPRRLHTFLSSLKTVDLDRRSHWSGVSFRGPLMFCLICILIIFCALYWIQPNMRLMKHVYDALCSGNQNFAYGVTNSPPFFAWSTTEPLEHQVPMWDAGKVFETWDANTWQEMALKKIIINNKSSLSKEHDAGWISLYTPVLAGTRGSLNFLSEQSVEAANANVNPACNDTGKNLLQWQLVNIMDAIQDRSIGPPCVGAWETACSEDSLFGQLARLYCSTTCKCRDAHSPQVLGDKGCPEQCSFRSDINLQEMGRDCEDLTIEELSGGFPENFYQFYMDFDEKFAGYPDPWRLDSYWNELLVNFNVASKDYAAPLKVEALQISDQLRSEGCAVIKALRSVGTDLCSEHSMFAGFQRFRFYCPKACDCGFSNIGRGCPESCTDY